MGSSTAHWIKQRTGAEFSVGNNPTPVYNRIPGYYSILLQYKLDTWIVLNPSPVYNRYMDIIQSFSNV